MAIYISAAVENKLRTKHRVERSEVVQCFENLVGGLLIDDRENHRTEPPTLWFIARTHRRRLLKVCYLQIGADQHVKSAFDPLDIEVRIYKAKAKPPPQDL